MERTLGEVISQLYNLSLSINVPSNTRGLGRIEPSQRRFPYGYPSIRCLYIVEPQGLWQDIYMCWERMLVSWRRRKWVDTSGMSQPEWRVILYVKRLIEALRNLMKSILVDDDQAVDNVLEIFKQACAEAIAPVTDYYMIHKVRLYTAFIVDSTLSSAS